MPHEKLYDKFPSTTSTCLVCEGIDGRSRVKVYEKEMDAFHQGKVGKGVGWALLSRPQSLISDVAGLTCCLGGGAVFVAAGAAIFGVTFPFFVINGVDYLLSGCSNEERGDSASCTGGISLVGFMAMSGGVGLMGLSGINLLALPFDVVAPELHRPLKMHHLWLWSARRSQKKSSHF